MPRVTHAVASRKRKKRVLKQTKGQFGHKHSRFRQAIKSLIKGATYAYRDRKVKKREFRRLWILRINAACRQEGISYSRFMKGLKTANVAVNRKMLADLAVTAPEAFKKFVDMSRSAPAAR